MELKRLTTTLESKKLTSIYLEDDTQDEHKKEMYARISFQKAYLFPLHRPIIKKTYDKKVAINNFILVLGSKKK